MKKEEIVIFPFWVEREGGGTKGGETSGYTKSYLFKRD